MMIRLMPSASADLLLAVEFYELQERDLGLRYWNHVEQQINQLTHSAGSHSRTHGYHRLLIPKFHCTVYYTIDADFVLIHRVLDGRRDPAWIRRQLGKEH